MMCLVTASWVGATQLLKATFTGVLDDLIANVTRIIVSDDDDSDGNDDDSVVVPADGDDGDKSGGNATASGTDKVFEKNEALQLLYQTCHTAHTHVKFPHPD